MLGGCALAIPRSCSVFYRLKHDDLEHINPLFREQGYATDETICFAGDPAEHSFVVADGRINLIPAFTIRQECIARYVTPGEFFGSLSTLGDDVYPDTAEARTQTCVLSIHADDFRRILEEQPTVALKVVDIMAVRLRTAQERVRQFSALTVEGRIANLLLVLSREFGRRAMSVY